MRILFLGLTLFMVGAFATASFDGGSSVKHHDWPPFEECPWRGCH